MAECLKIEALWFGLKGRNRIAQGAALGQKFNII